jgi:predicted phage-related endonuclease
MSADQGSAAWMFERAGKATASRVKDVVSKLRNGAPAKARDDYMWELVIERITGSPSDHFTNAAMMWGIENEMAARMAYEAHSGAMVEAAGLVLHPTIPNCGGSPDGLIGDDGGLEIKCPFNSAIHLRTVLDGMPEDHVYQVQGNMAVTGRAWWDFVSFDPRLPDGLSLYVQRIDRDEEMCKRIEVEVIAFLGEVDALAAELSAVRKGRAA